MVTKQRRCARSMLPVTSAVGFIFAITTFVCALVASPAFAIRLSGGNLLQSGGKVVVQEIRFPSRDIPEANTYQFIELPLTDYSDFTITSVLPDPTCTEKTHHFSLWLCTGGIRSKGIVTRSHGGRVKCNDMTMLVGFDNMDATAKPEKITFPGGFGKTIGPNYMFTHAMLELHVNAPVAEDTSGFIIEGVVGEANVQQVSTIILAPMVPFQLPPGRSSTSIHFAETLQVPTRIIFSHFHFHSRGVAIEFQVTSADGNEVYLSESYVRANNATNTVLYQGGLYIPSESRLNITCFYSTLGETGVVREGFESSDEMCNVFLIGSVDSCDPRSSLCSISTVYG